VTVLIVDDDPLVELTLRHFLEKATPGTASMHVTDGAAALRALAGGKFEAVFLDLELPELDGRSLIKALAPSLPVVIVSAHTDFAAHSYEFNVVDYLVKPLEFSRFLRAWQKVLARSQEEPGRPQASIVVRDGSKLVPISLDRLLYLEAQANYTRFVCPDRAVLSLVTLKQLEETLPPEFMRVHRSYIVNTRLIQLIEGATIKIGDRKVPVGETYRQEVLKRFAPLTDDR
jgi:DNA-binding LytR/AlgR family response regulator